MADGTGEEIPLAWTAMPYRAPVFDKHGAHVGTAESLLGDEARDIFHGSKRASTSGSSPEPG